MRFLLWCCTHRTWLTLVTPEKQYGFHINGLHNRLTVHTHFTWLAGNEMISQILLFCCCAALSREEGLQTHVSLEKQKAQIFLVFFTVSQAYKMITMRTQTKGLGAINYLKMNVQFDMTRKGKRWRFLQLSCVASSCEVGIKKSYLVMVLESAIKIKIVFCTFFPCVKVQLRSRVPEEHHGSGESSKHVGIKNVTWL